MQAAQQQAILSIALLAAFADGNNDEREREHIRGLAQSLGQDSGLDLSRLYQDVLFKRVDLASVCAQLTDPAERQFAYEMAVCVCDADGSTSAAESAFLADLKIRLAQASTPTSTLFQRDADTLAHAGQNIVPMQTATPLAQQVPNNTALVNTAEIDSSILKSSILNGALELLPQTWASVAIIPLQIKLVYNIGQRYGYELDQGHIREFISTVGVGLTSQYLEQFGRKLMGGLFGKVGGKWGATIGGAATGMAFSFASTYALGQVAKRYYAGGRTMSAALLKQTFQETLTPAKDLQTKYLPEIQKRASTLNATEIMALVKGK
ncbi:MAG: YcjF family protein [Deefgea sp.]